MASKLTLYLVRHAKSDWSDDSLPDIMRPLNKRGNADAPEMAQRLLDRKVKPGLMVTSTAVRAYSTALVFARMLGIDPGAISLRHDLYDTGKEEYIRVINQCAGHHDNIMLFGHNPVITELAGLLGELRTDNVPTTGVVAYEFTGGFPKSPSGEGRLLFYDYPRSQR